MNVFVEINGETFDIKSIKAVEPVGDGTFRVVFKNKTSVIIKAIPDWWSVAHADGH